MGHESLFWYCSLEGRPTLPALFPSLLSCEISEAIASGNSVSPEERYSNDLLALAERAEKKNDFNLFSMSPDDRSDLKGYESYIDLAIDIFKAREPELIQSLKDFLTILPSPVSIENVLIQAVYQIAEREPDIARWLLHHPHYLMPELDLEGTIRESFCVLLEDQGFVLSKQFRFEADNQMLLQQATEMGLFDKAKQCDRLLDLFVEEFSSSPEQ